jgi:nicotinate-nucleotide--dimethylbenzimidazole phosphoribosyltransferase
VDLPAVTAPDADARRTAVAQYSLLAVPTGALGRLADLGVWLAAVQGQCPPRPPGRPRVVVIAADHGIAAAGVSADPPGATARQVESIREQNAPVTVVATVAGASVRVVDVGVDHEPQDGALERYRVRRGSGRIDREDALTADEAERAVAIGRALVDEEVDAGADLLVPSSLGVGATTPASVLVALLCGVEPVAVIGRGSGIDDNGWMRKAAAVRDAMRRGKPYLRDPMTVLATAGGADLAVLAGFLVQAALRKTPVLLDGLVVGAAALLADEIAPGAKEWWLAAGRSPEPAMSLVIDRLGLPPLVDLGIRLGDGTGAAAVVPLVQMAARLVAETAVAEPPAAVPSAAGTPAGAPVE